VEMCHFWWTCSIFVHISTRLKWVLPHPNDKWMGLCIKLGTHKTVFTQHMSTTKCLSGKNLILQKACSHPTTTCIYVSTVNGGFHIHSWKICILHHGCNYTKITIFMQWFPSMQPGWNPSSTTEKLHSFMQ